MFSSRLWFGVSSTYQAAILRIFSTYQVALSRLWAISTHLESDKLLNTDSECLAHIKLLLSKLSVCPAHLRLPLLDSGCPLTSTCFKHIKLLCIETKCPAHFNLLCCLDSGCPGHVFNKSSRFVKNIWMSIVQPMF